MSHKIALETARILVIDDEPDITEIVESFLSEAGYIVGVENSSERALETARKFDPQVIILDIMMPGVSGYDICQQIKSEKSLSHIPVIFLTGKDKGDDMGRSFKSGGDMYIKKPFSCERLLEIVNIIVMSSTK